MEEKHSIGDYLSHIGASLPSEGHGWRPIKCPFHGDKHASAGVNFEKGRFKCHGCGVSGDVYDLIMEKEGGTYLEAVKFAESISLTGNRSISSRHKSSSAIPSDERTLGRRGSSVSSRSSGSSTSRTRRLSG
jgi:hypothetical protein